MITKSSFTKNAKTKIIVKSSYRNTTSFEVSLNSEVTANFQKKYSTILTMKL